MARDINISNQQNLWGRAATTGRNDIQRGDFFMLDFSSAQQNIRTVLGQNVPPNFPDKPLLPQLVRSIALPELRTKAEPFRRDSIAYNMPSWDDPLDPVKIVFVLDTDVEGGQTEVTALLDAWLALTRAGRGGRQHGYYISTGWLTLNQQYGIDFSFDLGLWLLRGANAQAFSTAGVVIASRANALTTPASSGISYLQNHLNYTLHNAWLASYRLTDFAMNETTLVNVEANFYVDSIDPDAISAIQGVPNLVNNPS